MTRYIALLRGINVGWNTKVSMPELKAVFESLGFANVATDINGGNIAFDVVGGNLHGIKGTVRVSSPHVSNGSASLESNLNAQIGRPSKTTSNSTFRL